METIIRAIKFATFCVGIVMVYEIVAWAFTLIETFKQAQP